MKYHNIPTLFDNQASLINGKNIGTDSVRYIQDAGQKTAGTTYIDKNTNELYVCVTTTNSVNNDGNFSKFNLKEAFNKLDNLPISLIANYMPWKHDLSADINTLLKHGFYTFKLTKEIIDLGITGALGFCMVLSTGYYSYSPLGIQIVFGVFGDVILCRNFYPDEHNENKNTFGPWKKISIL